MIIKSEGGQMHAIDRFETLKSFMSAEYKEKKEAEFDELLDRYNEEYYKPNRREEVLEGILSEMDRLVADAYRELFP